MFPVVLFLVGVYLVMWYIYEKNLAKVKSKIVSVASLCVGLVLIFANINKLGKISNITPYLVGVIIVFIASAISKYKFDSYRVNFWDLKYKDTIRDCEELVFGLVSDLSEKEDPIVNTSQEEMAQILTSLWDIYYSISSETLSEQFNSIVIMCNDLCGIYDEASQHYDAEDMSLREIYCLLRDELKEHLSCITVYEVDNTDTDEKVQGN